MRDQRKKGRDERITDDVFSCGGGRYFVQVHDRWYDVRTVRPDFRDADSLLPGGGGGGDLDRKILDQLKLAGTTLTRFLNISSVRAVSESEAKKRKL